MATTPEARLRRDLVEVCRRLHERRLIGAGEGNVSCRLGRDRLLVTPSGASKGYLRPADLVVVDLAGEKVRGRGRPSTELLMHLAAYAARPDAGAVVHAHPLTAVAFTVAGRTRRRTTCSPRRCWSSAGSPSPPSPPRAPTRCPGRSRPSGRGTR